MAVQDAAQIPSGGFLDSRPEPAHKCRWFMKLMARERQRRFKVNFLKIVLFSSVFCSCNLCVHAFLFTFCFTSLLFQSFEVNRSSQVSTGSSHSERSSYGDFTHSHSHGAINLMDL